MAAYLLARLHLMKRSSRRCLQLHKLQHGRVHLVQQMKQALNQTLLHPAARCAAVIISCLHTCFRRVGNAIRQTRAAQAAEGCLSAEVASGWSLQTRCFLAGMSAHNRPQCCTKPHSEASPRALPTQAPQCCIRPAALLLAPQLLLVVCMLGRFASSTADSALPR